MDGDNISMPTANDHGVSCNIPPDPGEEERMEPKEQKGMTVKPYEIPLKLQDDC